MTTLTQTQNLTLTPLGCLNGLGCPQCSAPLVDTFRGVINHDRVTKDCNCTACDYTSTYNVETMLLNKTY